MPSSGLTSLFEQSSDHGPRAGTFVISVIVHGIAFSILGFALAYKPPFTKVMSDRYSVRNLDLIMPEMQQLAANARIPIPKDRLKQRKAAPSPAAPPKTAQAKLGPQTLIQPDVPKPIQLAQEIPLPQIVIWAPSKVQVKHITPPQPQKPAISDVKPSVESPNQELKLADVNIASSFHPSTKNIVQPSTTSPVTVRAQLQVEAPPVTASQTALQGTPVQILSLSSLRASSQSVDLPPVNETKASDTQGAFGQGQSQNGASGQGGANESPNGSSGGSADAGNAGPGQSGNGGNTGSGNKPGTATLITVPRDGHFGSVIVGNSLQDRYPEVGEVWSGRLTYTAYVHVGLTKSWILQFSLPHPADPSHTGTVARLDAPWPYNIVRPNLEPGSIDADALMVHGFVNQSGHFETLSVIFPESFPHAQFVLAALQQWLFRPAAQDGQPAKVEVVLIIPDEYE